MGGDSPSYGFLAAKGKHVGKQTATKAEKAGRKQRKERKNRQKKVRGVKKAKVSAAKK